VAVAHRQDSPSLGDAARQARQQKQKQSTKDAQGKEVTAPKTPKVITNDEIPEHAGAATRTGGDSPLGGNDSTSSSAGAKLSAEQWKSQIQAQKNAVSSLQSEIDKLNDSIHFAPGNCVANCVQWNERQKEKQGEVERMRSQLEDQKKRLEDMQDSARQQGYGSSVYDP
jgi:hypothetical protein